MEKAGRIAHPLKDDRSRKHETDYLYGTQL